MKTAQEFRDEYHRKKPYLLTETRPPWKDQADLMTAYALYCVKLALEEGFEKMDCMGDEEKNEYIKEWEERLK